MNQPRNLYDDAPEEERAEWRKVFETVVAELSAALGKNDLIFHLRNKEIETPVGRANYGMVLLIFEDCSNDDYRKIAANLSQEIAGECLAVREALEELDASDMPRA